MPTCASRLSFSTDTLVQTPGGEQPIASLQVGEHVTSYDPTTGKATTQTITHVYINQDTDRLDVMLAVPATSDATPTATAAQDAATVREQRTLTLSHGRRGPPDATTAASTAASVATSAASAATDAAIHTTANHPWLTADRGWVVAGQLHVGEPVRLLNGGTATVVGLHAIAGVGAMWDLSLDATHTFAVGDVQAVVHNTGPCASGLSADDPYIVELPRARYPETANHIEDAIAKGQPEVTQWDPSLKDANRQASLARYPTKTGFDRDEWPMASTRQGGAGADIKYINQSDNRGAGKYIALRLAELPGKGVGYWFRIVIK